MTAMVMGFSFAWCMIQVAYNDFTYKDFEPEFVKRRTLRIEILYLLEENAPVNCKAHEVFPYEELLV
jgi:hypothetical protein